MSKVRPVQVGPCIRHCPKLVSAVSCAWGYRGEANPELSRCPSPGGLPRAGHVQHRASVAIKLSMGTDYPQSCLGGREGRTLCLDQRHATFYMEVCKIRLHKPPPAPSLKATPTFFSWMTHC